MKRLRLSSAAAVFVITMSIPCVIAAADSIPVVPPEPEHAGDSNGLKPAPASEDAVSKSVVDDPGAEILRLRQLIGSHREEIESSRSADLDQVDDAYRSRLASIDPKDMFETDAEHREREAREKSEARLEKAKSESEVNRKYDDLLSEAVEPLFQHVRGLLGEADVVPPDAVAVHLEKYDPERGVFIGGLEIDSDLMGMKARLIVPMKREAARTFWKNKGSVIGRMSLAMDVHSLDIEIEEFWLEDPQSASRTEERIAVLDLVSPPEAVSASEEQRRRADGLRTSASSLAKRAARGASDSDPLGTDARKVKGWIGEYNRLVGEVKAVFGKDRHVQGLKTLSYRGSNSQAAGAVVTAAGGLEAYMTSFVSHDAFKASASSLAKRAARGASDSDPLGTDARKAKGWIGEYNRLVGEVKAVFGKDRHVQGLKTLSYRGSNSQAAGAVATAAGGLEAYMTSFVSHDAFKASASSLAKRAARGASDSDPLGTDARKVKGWIGEYNRLVGEVKTVFGKDRHVQGLKTLSYRGSNSQAAGAVATAAGGLEAYMTSFVSHDAFKASASSLAKRAARGASDSDPLGTDARKAKGWIGEYNRLVGEVKAVFGKDRHVQGLKTLSYRGSNSQAAGAVATAARKFSRFMDDVKESPRQVAAETVADAAAPSPSYRLLDHLPYSGRFSPEAIKLAGLLGRWFSPDSKDDNGWTDLHYAAALNLPGLASALLEAGADPDSQLKSDGGPFGGDVPGTLSAFGADDLGGWARSGHTPMHFAAWFNADLAAPHLIAGGAESDPQSSAGHTPLSLAAWENSRTVAEFLIGRGANVQMASRDGWTPMDYALYWKSSDTAALLRRHGGQCNKACQ